MAFSGGPVSAEHVEMVVMVTGFEDRPMITNALQSNHGNVETVINEYLDDASKVSPLQAHLSLRWPSSCLLTPSHLQFKRKYGWDEAAFSSERENENTAGNNTAIPGGRPSSRNIND